MSHFLDSIKKNFELLATTIIGAILAILIQAGNSGGTVLIVGTILLIGAIMLRANIESKRPWNVGQIATGVVLGVIVWIGIYLGISASKNEIVQSYEGQIDMLSTENAMKQDLLFTAQAERATWYVQRDVNLRPNPGNLSATKGILTQCVEVQYIKEIAIDETLWVNVYSQFLKTDGWVEYDSVSRNLGICPTFTATATITPTSTITLTPTEMPTITPTPSQEKIMWDIISKYFNYLNNDEYEEAWAMFDPRYQATHDKLEWRESVLNKTFRTEIYLSEVKPSGNTTIANGTLYITPDFQPEQSYDVTICLVRKNFKEQWLILDIPDNQTCKF